MAEYRWNKSEFAAGYDAAAQHIHPFYTEVQDIVLKLLTQKFDPNEEFLLYDLGGGSGRFAARVLEEFSAAKVVVIDQSDAFLALAERQLHSFGERGLCQLARLQDDWDSNNATPSVIVSMSSIHHLDPGEKQSLFRRVQDTLASGGQFINGDEVRPESDEDYLAECQKWAKHMHQVIASGFVPEPMHDALRKWEDRNVGDFGQPRSSGDDCHETVDQQCEYLSAAGFRELQVPWQKDLWAVFHAEK